MADLTGLPVRLATLASETDKLQRQLAAHTQQSHGNDSSAGHKGGAGGGTDCDGTPTNTKRGPTVLLPHYGSEGSGLPVSNQLPRLYAAYDDDARHLMQMGQSTGKNFHRFNVAKHRTGSVSGNTERTWTEWVARGVPSLSGTNAALSAFEGTFFPDGMGSDTGDGYVLSCFFASDAGTDVFSMRTQTFAGVTAATAMNTVVITGAHVPPDREDGFCGVQSLSASKGVVWNEDDIYIFDVIDATDIQFNTAPTTAITIGAFQGTQSSGMGASPTEFVCYDQISNAVGGQIQVFDHDGVEKTLYPGSHESFWPSFQNVLPNFLLRGMCRVNSMWCFLFTNWDGTNAVVQSAHPTQHPA